MMLGDVNLDAISFYNVHLSYQNRELHSDD